MSKIRFGLIGHGLWGQHHANAITKCADAELVAIAVRSEESKAAAAEAHPGVATLTDYQALLARDDIDAVNIVVPSDLHESIATAALEAGKHVLLEKPMTVDSASSRRLTEIAAAKERLLAVGFELRFSDLWARVHDMIASGAIGDPLYVLIELWRRPYRPGSEGWRFQIDRVGNWVLEEPIHFFDLARWYLESHGEPLAVYAQANSRQDGHPELQDNFSAMVRFPNAAYAVVTQTLSAFQHHQTAKITGTTGALWASWSGAMDRDLHPKSSLQYYDGNEVQDIPLEKPVGELFELEEEVAGFANAILNNSAPAAGGVDGIWSVRLCEAAQESIQQRCEISVTEA